MRFDFLFYGLLFLLCYNNAMAAACLQVVSNGSQNLVVYDPSTPIQNCSLLAVTPSEWSSVSVLPSSFTDLDNRLQLVQTQIAQFLQFDPTSVLSSPDLTYSFVYGVLAVLTLWSVGFAVGVVKKVLGLA